VRIGFVFSAGYLSGVKEKLKIFAHRQRAETLHDQKHDNQI
jgi:hypothetical protein